MKKRYAVLLGCLIIFLDYVIKAWVNNNIPLLNYFPIYPYGGIGILRNFYGFQFSIVHTTNTGAAWGFLENWPLLLVFIRILFVFILSTWLYVSKGKGILFPITLIISGAIGNLIDFFLYGHVIDYLYFVVLGRPCPIFNLADMSIFFGVIILFFRTYGKKSAPASQKTGG